MRFAFSGAPRTRNQASASGACAKRAAGFVQAAWGQTGDPAPKRGARQCVNVVEVDDAVAWHSILGGGQLQFGHEPAAGAGQSRYDNCSDPFCDRISGEYEHGPVTAGGSNEPEFTAPHWPSQPSPPPAPSRRFERGLSRPPSWVARRRLARPGRPRVRPSDDGARHEGVLTGRFAGAVPSARPQPRLHHPHES